MDVGIITKYSRQVGKTLTRNSPSILTGLGVAGLLATVMLAVKATPKALESIEMEEIFRKTEESFGEPLTPIDIIEVCWKHYIPTVVMGAATITCMIGANHIHLRRNAALVSLFSITETALKEYQAQVVKTIGEKKESQIQDDLAQKRLDDKPITNQPVIITGNGSYPCFDTFSGRYFESDIETIRQKVNEFNQRLLREGWLCINEFYYELGLESIELGDEMGWIAERSLLELKTTTKFATDGKPCLVMGYSVQPHHV
jgi:hypothetical protein